MASKADQMEVDIAKASPEVMVVEHGSASAPLTLSAARRATPMEASWREGSVAPEVGGESSRALVLAGGDSQVRGEPPAPVDGSVEPDIDALHPR